MQYRDVRASAIPGGSEEILLDFAIRDAGAWPGGGGGAMARPAFDPWTPLRAHHVLTSLPPWLCVECVLRAVSRAKKLQKAKL